MFSPVVVTSRVAKKSFDKIKATHADILRGMANQQVIRQQHAQQKSVEMQTEQTMKAEVEKEQAVQSTEVAKSRMEFDLKQAELDIKRAALNASE